MRINKIICDHCGAEITAPVDGGAHGRSGEILFEFEPDGEIAWQRDTDLCISCERLLRETVDHFCGKHATFLFSAGAQMFPPPGGDPAQTKE